MFLWNFGEFFPYFIQRCFSNHGDISGFINFTKLSGWWLFIPAFYIFIRTNNYLFQKGLYKLFSDCRIKSKINQIGMFIVITCVLFLFFSIRGLDSNNNALTHFISVMAILFAPIILIIYWPKNVKKWCVIELLP